MTQDMYDRLHLKVPRTKGKYGVEIEVEGDDLPREGLFRSQWAVEEDGSLRGDDTAEYVLTSPMSFYGAKKAITNLQRAFRVEESTYNESVRAGVHVHLNVQNYTPTQLLTLLTTYYILEDHFSHWCGKARVGNHFCLRSVDAEAMMKKLLDTCQKKDWRYLNTDDLRYSALNLTSLFKYGSIEFRAMRSTRHFDEVKKWLGLIEQLSIGAQQFDNPRSVVRAVSEIGGPDRFVRMVMGPLADEFLRMKNVGIMEGLRNVQPIAFLVDWGKFDAAKINPFV